MLKNADCSALRSTGYDGGLLFSSEPLRTDELLQVVMLLHSSLVLHFFLVWCIPTMMHGPECFLLLKSHLNSLHFAVEDL